MELRTINTFLHIAELHSFSRAARELGYSQSAVSSQIAQLEAELETPLFDRVGKTVRLTGAGETFLGYARTLLATVEQAQAALPRFRALAGAEVVQGSPDNIELTAQGVDKGTALLALADLLHIPRESTVAVGDSENDRAMLEKAGIAAVMANGMPHFQALADLVSTNDCDHDGVAELFERLGL